MTCCHLLPSYYRTVQQCFVKRKIEHNNNNNKQSYENSNNVDRNFNNNNSKRMMNNSTPENNFLEMFHCLLQTVERKIDSKLEVIKESISQQNNYHLRPSLPSTQWNQSPWMDQNQHIVPQTIQS